MSLQSRITLGFVAVLVLAGAGAGYATYSQLQQQFQADVDRLDDVASRAVMRRIKRDGTDLYNKLERLTVVKFETFARAVNDAALKSRLYETTRDIVAADPYLDALWVFDTSGAKPKLVAAPHAPAGDSAPAELNTFLGHPPYDMSAVVFAQPRSDAGGRHVRAYLVVGERIGKFTVFGGRLIGKSTIEDLQFLAAGIYPVTVRLMRTDGAVIAGNEPPPGDYKVVSVTVPQPWMKDTALRAELYVSREPIQRRRAELLEMLGLVGLGAVFIAFVLARMVAKRISRPVEQLAAATQKLAEGERNIELPSVRHGEIGGLVSAFDELTRQLESSEQRRKQVARVAAWKEVARELAHELKNPLTPIQMSVDTIRRAYERQHPDFDEIFEESTQTIREEVERLKQIASTYGDLARLPAPEPSSADLNAIVQQSVQLYRENSDEAVIEQTLDETLGVLQLDVGLMTQVVQNLIQNAIQATTTVERSGLVKVWTRRLSESEVELAVEDNGCGISPEEQDQVFLHHFTTKSGGSGIGLTVAWRVISEHGGRIFVQSEEDVFTRFVVRLPRRSTTRRER